MGLCENCNKNKVNLPKLNKGELLIKCTYEIKDFNETQIMNGLSVSRRNLDIESKIKIWNNYQREKFIFKKKFNKLGENAIVFIIEKRLNDMSFMFSDCSSLKKIEFKSLSIPEVTNMIGIFNQCNELEYIYQI